MSQIKIPNTSIVFDSPLVVDQSTLNWQPGLTLTSQPTQQGGTGYGWMAIPKPGSFDANPPQASPILFGKQAPSLSAGGIQIPNSSTTIKNPS